MSRKLIVNITDDEITDEDAFKKVLKVIQMGKISKTALGEQYCFVTAFDSGLTVSVRKNKASESFYIGKDK
jgi:hypothetical protein